VWVTIIPHPKPYKLHWLNEDGDITIQNQVKVQFSFGKYQDKVFYDVVLMSAYFCPYLMFKFGGLINFLCLKDSFNQNLW